VRGLDFSGLPLRLRHGPRVRKVDGMRKSQRRDFGRIFSDAHVIDVDLSSWDKSIDFYVLADHMDRVEGSRLPLFAVHFLRVRSFKLDSNAASVPDLAAHEHVQWRIDDSEIKEGDREMTISLRGDGATPSVEIVCEDVQINPFALRVFDELFPGWDEPWTGLARPGPGALMDLFGSARGKQLLRRQAMSPND
jgi:hypothetical protein